MIGIARHTFYNIYRAKKFPPQMLQKLYRHSSITTTIGYQANFINKDADDALAAVIGGVKAPVFSQIYLFGCLFMANLPNRILSNLHTL